MRRKSTVALLSLVAALGCGRLHFEPTPLPDSGNTDAGHMDAQADANMDADTDAQLDANMDAQADADDNDANVVDDAAIDADVDAGPDAGPGRDLDYCAELPRLRGPVTIDGVLERGLLLRAMTQVGWTSTPETLPSDQPTSYAIAWQPDGIYFYVKVVDPSRLPALPEVAPWTGDSAEVYVDGDGIIANAPGYDADALQLCAAAPADDDTPSTRGETYRDTALAGVWSPTSFSVFPTSDGYVLETVVSAADLSLDTWALSIGGRVGVDISINVSGPTFTPDPDAGITQPRIGQYFLSVSDIPASCNGAPYCQPLAFCTPLLID